MIVKYLVIPVLFLRKYYLPHLAWNLKPVKAMINIPHQMLSSAGSIVAVPDTATVATVYTRRFGYASAGSIVTVPDTAPRYIPCAALCTIRYAIHNALRYIQCATQ